MGIFDFFFKKNKPSKSADSQTKKKSLLKPRTSKNHFDQNWEIELLKLRDLALVNSQKQNTRIYYLHNFSVEEYSKVLQLSYAIGLDETNIAHTTMNDLAKILGMFSDFAKIIRIADQAISENILTAVKGFISSIIRLFQAKKQRISLSRFIADVSNYRNSYLLSLALEKITEIDSDELLSCYYHSINNLEIAAYEDVKQEINDHIWNEIRKINTTKTFITEDKNTVDAHIDFVRSSGHKVEKSYAESIQNLKESSADAQGLYALNLLLLFQTHGSYPFSDLMKKWPIDLECTHQIVNQHIRIYTLFYRESANISLTTLTKFVNAYLKEEPLDQKSYNNLRLLAARMTKLKNFKSIHSLLAKQAENLYNVHSPDIHRLIYSGTITKVQKTWGLSALGYGGKSWDKIKKDTILQLGQVIQPCYVSQDHSQATYELQLGEDKVVINEGDLTELNQSLFRQAVPYQMYQLCHSPQEKSNTNSSMFVSRLLLSEDQYTSIQSHSQRGIMNEEAWKKYHKLEFYPAENVPAVENNVAKIKKKEIDEINQNPFARDPIFQRIQAIIQAKSDSVDYWMELMLHTLNYPNAVRPSAKWKTEAERLMAAIPLEDQSKVMAFLVKDFLEHNIDEIEKLQYARALIWLQEFLPAKAQSRNIEALLDFAFEKVPGGPRSISLSNSCKEFIEQNPNKYFWEFLNRRPHFSNYGRYQTALRKWSEELYLSKHDKTLNFKEFSFTQLKFINGSKIEHVQDGVFRRWRFTNSTLKAEWINAAGKKLSKAPKIDKAKSKELMAWTKFINSEQDRLFRFIDSLHRIEVKWKLSDWQEIYLEDSFISMSIDNHLWILEEPESRKIALSRDRSLFLLGESPQSQQQKAYTPSSEDIEKISIRPFHISWLNEIEIQLAKEYIKENKIAIPVNYFYRNNQSIDEIKKELGQAQNFDFPMARFEYWSSRHQKSSESGQFINVCRIPNKGHDVMVRVNKMGKLEFRQSSDIPQINYSLKIPLSDYWDRASDKVELTLLEWNELKMGFDEIAYTNNDKSPEVTDYLRTIDPAVISLMQDYIVELTKYYPDRVKPSDNGFKLVGAKVEMEYNTFENTITWDKNSFSATKLPYRPDDKNRFWIPMSWDRRTLSFLKLIDDNYSA